MNEYTYVHTHIHVFIYFVSFVFVYVLGVAWTLIIRSIILFWKKSRAIQIFDACFRFAITIGILYGQPYVW